MMLATLKLRLNRCNPPSITTRTRYNVDLFLLVINWIMRTTTEGKKNGIQWNPWTQLEDLDFADDLALLSHNHDQMQGKTTGLAATSERTGLKINRGKSKVLRINTINEISNHSRRRAARGDGLVHLPWQCY